MNDLVFHSGMGFVPESPHFFHVVRGGPLENLWGGGVEGAGEVQKNIFARGKIKWKKFIHANKP